MNNKTYMGKYEIQFISSPEKAKSVEEFQLHLNKIDMNLIKIDEVAFEEIKSNRGKNVDFWGNEFKASRSILNKLAILKDVVVYRGIIIYRTSDLCDLIDVPVSALKNWLQPLIRTGLVKLYNGGSGMAYGTTKILVHPGLFFKVHPDKHVSHLKKAIEEYNAL